MFLTGHLLTNVAILLAETQVASARLDCRYSINPDKSIGGLSPRSIFSDPLFVFISHVQIFTTTKYNPLFFLFTFKTTQDIRVRPALFPACPGYRGKWCSA